MTVWVQAFHQDSKTYFILAGSSMDDGPAQPKLFKGTKDLLVENPLEIFQVEPDFVTIGAGESDSLHIALNGHSVLAVNLGDIEDLGGEIRLSINNERLNIQNLGLTYDANLNTITPERLKSCELLLLIQQPKRWPFY